MQVSICADIGNDCSIMPESIASDFGVPLYTNPYFTPGYAEGRYGRWKIVRGGFVLDRGYYSGLWGVVGLPALMREREGGEGGWDTWMSLSPHEIESQRLGIDYAHGSVVVMGLGMGWVAANIALSPRVTRVSVIERDPEVIELFSRTQGFADLPDEAKAKLSIVEADALLWQPEQAVDFLYADIWRTLSEPQTLDDVRQMQINVGAREVYFWGQELWIHRLAITGLGEKGGLVSWAEAVAYTVRERIGLPLLQPTDFDYPDLITQIAALRRQRFPLSPENSSPSL